MNQDSISSGESRIRDTPSVETPASPTRIYMTAGEMPKAFTDEVLMKAFTDYSVALGRVKDGKPC